MLGRLVTDLYPLQSETPLEEVRTFERFTGGYGGNVGIGLARLGVATAVVSAVGDDGHGRAIVRDLGAEGVDTRWVDGPPHAPDRARLLRALAARPLPAARLPVPDLPRPGAAGGRPAATDRAPGRPLVYVSGSAFAQEPSRITAFAALDHARAAPGLATILDLDWRPGYWTHPEQYPAQMQAACARQTPSSAATASSRRRA